MAASGEIFRRVVKEIRVNRERERLEVWDGRK